MYAVTRLEMTEILARKAAAPSRDSGDCSVIYWVDYRGGLGSAYVANSR